MRFAPRGWARAGGVRGASGERVLLSNAAKRPARDRSGHIGIGSMLLWARGGDPDVICCLVQVQESRNRPLAIRFRDVSSWTLVDHRTLGDHRLSWKRDPRKRLEQP